MHASSSSSRAGVRADTRSASVTTTTAASGGLAGDEGPPGVDPVPRHAGRLQPRPVGLSLQDIDLQLMGFPNLLAALQTGGVDVGCEVEPFLTQSLDSGSVAVFKRGEEIVPGAQLSILARKREPKCSGCSRSACPR
jgi:hypothetical protein